jgi:hypothetical protein
VLDFGNCWDAGQVNVYLDDILLASAPANTSSQIVTFAFSDGGVVRLRDENGNAVVNFRGIHISCAADGKILIKSS